MFTFKSAEQVTAEQYAQHRAACARECERRIYAIANKHARENLQSEYSFGLLNEQDQATYRSLREWIMSMIYHSRSRMKNPLEDEDWPIPSEAVAELAKRF